MSTLKRETSPQQGFQPSLLPQHEGGMGEYLPTGESNPLPTKMNESTIIVPVFNEGRAVQDIQTHAGVSILANAGNTGIGWVDSHVEGSPHTNLAITAIMTSGTGMTISLDFSHDGVNFFSNLVTSVYDGVATAFSTTVDIELPARYFRVYIKNKDATNPKTTSAYVRLKA